jgi:hypothetical protein
MKYTFVKLEAYKERIFASIITCPGSIPNKLSADAIISILQVLHTTINESENGVRMEHTSNVRAAPSG